MRLITSFLLFPMACVGFFLITGLVMLIFVRRGTQAVQDSMQRIETLQQKIPATEYADGITPSDPGNAENAALQPCTACGGSNPPGAAVCQYCGRKL
jgi:hypothetical protein